ncbi:MAG: hypothetical protein IAE89_13795 [Anaerolineae bacterium]|nr:hypothetical protein [Anaerolineae bacterium]
MPPSTTVALRRGWSASRSDAALLQGSANDILPIHTWLKCEQVVVVLQLRSWEIQPHANLRSPNRKR